jgi:hypothetical protein
MRKLASIQIVNAVEPIPNAHASFAQAMSPELTIFANKWNHRAVVMKGEPRCRLGILI